MGCFSMKKIHRSMVCVLSLALTTLSLQLIGCGTFSGNNSIEESSDKVDSGEKVQNIIKIDLNDHQTFNDTNNDGYGEFQGWGTSLCWWANRVGYSDKLTHAASELFFDAEKGLGLNIGRYNIGGGDNVTDFALSDVDNPSDFLHEAHIKRSDSIIPGYAIDITPIDLSLHPEEYYLQNFERADFSCGYAWNYNWDADKNQINVLKAASQKAGNAFIAEAFSNSPPYFMTISGCSSGNKKPARNNLRDDSYTAFACYLADVIEHLEKSGVTSFQSITPMNEPATDYWSAYSEKQEGCHFSPGESQSKIITELNRELQNKGIDIIISSSDETSINATISSYKKLSPEAKDAIARLDTHTYHGNKRKELKETALDAGKNLWMSEVDGTFSLGKESGAMEAALGFADAIMQDMNGMYPTAWIMWNAADMHIDSTNEFDTLTRQEAENILNNGEPFWGVAIADHDAQELLTGKKYYGFGQFTRYIRPGFCIVKSGKDTLAAYDPQNNKLVIVTMNSNSNDELRRFDLENFDKDISEITAIRTSGAMENGENWRDVTDEDNIKKSNNFFSAQANAYSITTYIVTLQ